MLADFLVPDNEVHIFRKVAEHPDINHLDFDFNSIGLRKSSPDFRLAAARYEMKKPLVVDLPWKEMWLTKDVNSDNKLGLRSHQEWSQQSLG